MNLKDLVGIHLLAGVDYGTEKIKQHTWDEELTDAGYLRFRLDGVTYIALEDPDDGYRSSMRELKVDERPPTYTFPPALVEGRYVDTETESSYDGGYKQDILELYDVLTGELVLRVGTHNMNDYYPGFVSSWKPEGLAINRHIKRA